MDSWGLLPMISRWDFPMGERLDGLLVLHPPSEWVWSRGEVRSSWLSTFPRRRVNPACSLRGVAAPRQLLGGPGWAVRCGAGVTNPAWQLSPPLPVFQTETPRAARGAGSQALGHLSCS